MSRQSSFSRASSRRTVPKPATALPAVSLIFAEPEQAQSVTDERATHRDSPKRDAATLLRKASIVSLNKGAAETDAADIMSTSPSSSSATNIIARGSSAWFNARPRLAEPEDESTDSLSVHDPASSGETSTNATLTPTQLQATPQPIPSSDTLSSGAPTASSVDDAVPVLSASPPEAQPATVRSTNGRLASLNPSASRFTLAMPLLGRPKVPLEQVIHPHGAATVSGSWPADSATTPAPDPQPLPNVKLPQLRDQEHEHKQEQGQGQGQEHEHEQELEQEREPEPPPTVTPVTAPWWGYIGLGSTIPVVPPQPSIVRPPSPPPTSPPTDVPTTELDTPSTWYAPWRWYTYSSSTTTTTTTTTTIAISDPTPHKLPDPAIPASPDPHPPQIHIPPTPVPRPSWTSLFISPSRTPTDVDSRSLDQTTAPGLPPPMAPKSLTPTSPSTRSRTPSPSPSKKSIPPSPRPPNIILPTFSETFNNPPRSKRPPAPPSILRSTLCRIFFSPEPEPESDVGAALPRLHEIIGVASTSVRRVVVIGVHGWFPGAFIRQVIGEPTGTSGKFASMMAAAVRARFDALEKLTEIVLEGEGTIARRVELLWGEYVARAEWVEDVRQADAILIATHSQGCIVSTHLIDRLIRQGHIRTTKTAAQLPPQHICCLAMCGIHLGPLLYLNTSTLVHPYLQYFETAAARELFEFQDSESLVARTYVDALGNVLEHGAKFVYVASMNDQVVPIYSGSFASATHPLLLRALYIDGEAYSSSDFLSKLLVLLLRIRNAGLDDSGLIAHLSEATAGSLNGIGHSTAYEEPATYALAVRFLFETSGVLAQQDQHPRLRLRVDPFTARAARNDYEIPWALRDVIANPAVAALFGDEFTALRGAFDDWHPRTSILRELRRKLEPIRRLPTSRL